MTDSTKKWEKPRLIVVERNRSEENVLSGCKATDIPTGMAGDYNTCRYTAASMTCVNRCSTIATS